MTSTLANGPPERVDIAVVGGGPAGASAALAACRAAPGADVVILDAARFPRDKVCGDGIAPQALDVLAGLGVDPAVLTAGSTPITAIRLRSPGGAVAARDFARHAWTVARHDFDHRLLEAALAAGATLRRHRVRRIVADAAGVLLDGAIRARVVIAADGAESVLRRAIVGAPRTSTVALAVRGYSTADAWPAGTQHLTMTAAGWPAYAWAFPIGDGRVNVGYGRLLRHRTSRAELATCLHELLPDAGAVRLRGHRLPLSTGRPRLAAGRVLLAGDAASLINPMTGEGIYYAVLSGSLAGAAAVGDDPAAAYRRSMRRHLGGHLRHTDLAATMARWTPAVDAMVRSAGADQRVFDAVVELGLGAGRLDARTVRRVAGALIRH